MLLQSKLSPALQAYLRYRPQVQKALTAFFVLYCLGSTYLSLTGRGKGAGRESKSGGRRGRGKGVPHTAARVLAYVLLTETDKELTGSVSDPLFYTRLKRLMRIVIPSIRSKEAAMLALHSSFLLARTALSLYVADLDGRIVSSLVTAQPALFLSNLARWIAVAVPATYTNSMLEYLQSELGLAYRTRLTKHALGTYLDPPASAPTAHTAEVPGERGDIHAQATEMALREEMSDGKGEQLFYKLANLDDRIKNADQVSGTMQY